jgi:glycosyltransferase involved in cell wall biosynthesis
MAKIAILYPTDPAGHVPSGIDSVIRGILKWAPPDLDYVLLGATSDQSLRPVGQEVHLSLGERDVRFLPLVTMDSKARKARVPLTLRYMRALWGYARGGGFDMFDILDFHRIEPVWLFRSDSRPKNVVVHQDMSVIRDKNCDIMWRHAPWLYEWMEHRLFSEMDRIFTVRQTAVERYAAIYPELAGRFAFIPTWVDTTVFSPPKSSADRAQLRAALRATLRLTESSGRILVFVGRLDRQKDPLLLLRAFCEAVRRETDLHLVIIGDGVLRSRVESACHELGLDGRVSFLGARPPAESADALRGSDLFVLSSAYEGMPIAVLEALATGLPVVSTNVGEIPLVVRDGVSGRIAVDRTPQGLADAIRMALEQAEQMTGPACELAVSPYHPEKVLNLLYDNHRRQARAGAG